VKEGMAHHTLFFPGADMGPGEEGEEDLQALLAGAGDYGEAGDGTSRHSLDLTVDYEYVEVHAPQHAAREQTVAPERNRQPAHRQPPFSVRTRSSLS